MTFDKLSPEQLRTYEQQLLARVPTDGAVGNGKLRAQLCVLGWNESLYWSVRNHLIQQGLLISGRGKGGSVRLVVQNSVQPASSAPQVPTVSIPPDEPYIAEKDLYEPMSEVIRSDWAKDHGLDDVIVEVTAAQGSKATGGRWTRPDISAASLRTFPYVPGRHFDVVTFEVKPQDQVTVSAVYEALAHLRAATRAYALVHVPHALKVQLATTLDDVTAEAKQQGVGLIVAEKPDDYDTWDEQVEPVRREPDPVRLNDFLAQQVTQSFRERVMKWLR